MKYIFAALLFFSFFQTGFTQKIKVLESSEKKAPEWINSIIKDYIIATGSGENIEAAQSNALLKVKERVITSIAENIQTSSEYYRGENTINGISNMVENYETATKTKSADITFLKGISLSQVEAFYWEKISDGTNIRVNYYLKYPFPEIQLKKLIMEFEKADRELTEQLNNILDNIPNLTTTEEMTEALSALDKLSDSFIDQRKEKVQLGKVKLSEMLKSIRIETIENQLGKITFTLKLGEKTVTTAKQPKVTSNCATITETRLEKTTWIIVYDYANCYEDPANAIKIQFRFGAAELKYQFNFDITASKAEIFLKDDINMTAPPTAGNEVNGVKVDITIVSKFDNPVIIEKIILNWENQAPVIIENINKEFSGKGNHDLSLMIDQPLDKVKYSSARNNLINGSIHYKTKTGEKFTYKIYSQPFTTNW